MLNQQIANMIGVGNEIGPLADQAEADEIAVFLVQSGQEVERIASKRTYVPERGP